MHCNRAPCTRVVLLSLLVSAVGCVDDLPPAAPASPDLTTGVEVGPARLDLSVSPGFDLGRTADARRPPPPDAALDGPIDDDRPFPPRADARPIEDATADLHAGRDAEPPRDAEPIGCGGDELCNGADDDCDGAIDEGSAPGSPGACGPYIARNCRIWLGFSTNDDSPPANATDWGNCPDRRRDGAGNLRCTDSGGDGRFHTVTLPVEERLSEHTRLGVRFECDADEVGDWVEQHCEVGLGALDDAFSSSLAAQDPTECSRDGVGDDRLTCVRTAGDGLFHRLGFADSVNTHTDLGAAFWCRDAEDVRRAADTERAVKVFIGTWSRPGNNTCSGQAIDVADAWGDCPADDSDDSGPQRCAGVVGGAGFSAFRPDGYVNGCDLLTLTLQINQGRP